MLLLLLNIDVGASSNGKGRGEDVEEEEGEDEVGVAEDDADDADDADEDEAESLDAATAVPRISITASGSRRTRSSCRVKCVSVIGAGTRTWLDGGWSTSGLVQEGIVGVDAGAGGRHCCVAAAAPATSTVMMPARSDMERLLCDADDEDE